jgi:hypothetical protein
MEATSEAFRILSSGLYSDKISAVLREVGCNAMDAHIVAGTPDLPIEVQLPTVLDHTLRIRDFGPGLDEAQMIELYTRYFKSDKRESNALVGGYGLGSKSPFCYIDSFNVAVAQNGEKRLYVAHVGAQGVPVLSLMGREPASSDWPHGVEVSFPVKPKDITEFHAKAKAIYRWFRVAPRIIGATPIEPVQTVLEGETFALAGTAEDGGRLLMGNVAYPIHIESVPAFVEIERFLLRNGLIVKASIGAVRPTAAREGLEYSPADRAALRQLMDGAMAELQEMLKRKAMREEATEWETRRRLQAKLRGSAFTSQELVSKLFSNGDEPPEVRRLIRDRLTATGITAPETIGSSGETRVFSYGYHRGNAFPAGRSEVCAGAHLNQGRLKLSLSYRHPAVVAVMDCPGADQRIRFMFRSKGRAWAEAKVIGVMGPDAEGMAKRIAAAFGGVEIVKVSSWPAPAKAPKDAKTGGPASKDDAVLHYSQVIRSVDAPEGRGGLKLGQPCPGVDLSTLGERGKYYIVARGTKPAFCEFLNRTEAEGRYIPVKTLDALWSAYEEARCQGVDLPVIEGVLVLENAQPCRWLEKEGWLDLVSALRDRLLAKREQLVAGFFEVPNLWSKQEEPCSWYQLHRYGAAAVLANLETTSLGWKACEPIVAARPTFARWVRELRSLKEGLRGDGADADKRQVALREALEAAGALLGQMHKARWGGRGLIGDESIWQKRFPRLALLNAAWMQKVLTDDGAVESYSHVAAMLQTALSLEIEA